MNERFMSYSPVSFLCRDGTAPSSPPLHPVDTQYVVGDQKHWKNDEFVSGVKHCVSFMYEVSTTAARDRPGSTAKRSTPVTESDSNIGDQRILKDDITSLQAVPTQEVSAV